MKNKFNLNNLPLAFFDDFFDIETDEVKQALLDIVNLVYNDYTVDEVQEMFSTFTKTAYEVYELNLYRCDYDDNDDFKQNLDTLIEVILFCSSQFETYKVYNPVKAFNSRARR